MPSPACNGAPDGAGWEDTWGQDVCSACPLFRQPLCGSRGFSVARCCIRSIGVCARPPVLRIPRPPRPGAASRFVFHCYSELTYAPRSPATDDRPAAHTPARHNRASATLLSRAVNWRDRSRGAPRGARVFFRIKIILSL